MSHSFYRVKIRAQSLVKKKLPITRCSHCDNFQINSQILVFLVYIKQRLFDDLKRFALVGPIKTIDYIFILVY